MGYLIWPDDEEDFDEHGTRIGGIPAPFSDRRFTVIKIIIWAGVAGTGVAFLYLQFAPAILQLFQLFQ